MPPFEKLAILGTRIASVTYDEATAVILDAAACDAAHAYICAVNVHTISIARREPDFRSILNNALLAVPDGKPLVWAHRVLGGRKLPGRVYGPTLMLYVCHAAAEQGVPIYLYGGAPDVPAKLSETLKSRFPKLKIVGAVSPPYRDDVGADAEIAREIDAINASGARICFVALGAPKQEIFMARHAAAIKPVQIGVGAAFDFHTDRVAQAPEWMQDAGLEWLFRFCAEPRRLWRRYLFYNPYFVARLTLQRLGLDAPSREAAREMAHAQDAHGKR